MFENCVHQLKNGRWITAWWIPSMNEYQAPMTAQEKKITGCHTYFARTLEGLGCTSYATRAGAIRRAKQVFGEVEF